MRALRIVRGDVPVPLAERGGGAGLEVRGLERRRRADLSAEQRDERERERRGRPRASPHRGAETSDENRDLPLRSAVGRERRDRFRLPHSARTRESCRASGSVATRQREPPITGLSFLGFKRGKKKAPVFGEMFASSSRTRTGHGACASRRSWRAGHRAGRRTARLPARRRSGAPVLCPGRAAWTTPRGTRGMETPTAATAGRTRRATTTPRLGGTARRRTKAPSPRRRARRVHDPAVHHGLGPARPQTRRADSSNLGDAARERGDRFKNFVVFVCAGLAFFGLSVLGAGRSNRAFERHFQEIAKVRADRRRLREENEALARENARLRRLEACSGDGGGVRTTPRTTRRSDWCRKCPRSMAPSADRSAARSCTGSGGDFRVSLLTVGGSEFRARRRRKGQVVSYTFVFTKTKTNAANARGVRRGAAVVTEPS